MHLKVMHGAIYFVFPLIYFLLSIAGSKFIEKFFSMYVGHFSISLVIISAVISIVVLLLLRINVSDNTRGLIHAQLNLIISLVLYLQVIYTVLFYGVQMPVFDLLFINNVYGFIFYQVLFSPIVLVIFFCLVAALNAVYAARGKLLALPFILPFFGDDNHYTIRPAFLDRIIEKVHTGRMFYGVFLPIIVVLSISIIGFLLGEGEAFSLVLVGLFYIFIHMLYGFIFYHLEIFLYVVVSLFFIIFAKRLPKKVLKIIGFCIIILALLVTYSCSISIGNMEW